MIQSHRRSEYTIYFHLLTLGLFALIIAFLAGISPIATKVSLADQPSPILQISKTAKPEPVAPGGLLTYTLAVTNTGDARATVLVITDTIPLSTTWHSGGSYFADRHEVLWVEPALEINECITKTFTVGVDADSVTNAGFIKNDMYGVKCAERVAPTTGTPIITTVKLADLAISKTGPPSIAAGERISYQITYTNTGGTAENVIITETLPVLLEYLSSNREPVVQQGQRVIWDVRTVVGGPHTLVLTGVVNSNILRPITLTNRVTVSTSVSEVFTGNNFGSCETRVIPTAVVKKIYLPIVLRDYSVLCNGGFETGNFDCWEHGGDLPQPIVSSPYAHSDKYAALLGDSSYCNTSDPDELGDHKAWMYQTFFVPFMDMPNLTFWYRVQTYDHIKWTDGRLGDSFDVYINDNLILQDNYDNYPDPALGCDSLQDLGWKQFMHDLTPFRGQKITLRLENVTRVDGWYNTWTYVDDVQIQAAAQ